MPFSLYSSIIYIFFINTHRCKTHTRGRISTHVPVFFFSMYLSISMWCGYMLLVFWFCHWQKSPSRKESADQRFCRAFSHDFSLRHVATKRSTDQLDSQFFDSGKPCRGYSSRLTEKLKGGHTAQLESGRKIGQNGNLGRRWRSKGR